MITHVSVIASVRTLDSTRTSGTVTVVDRFFVPGKPVPQGSLKFINGRPIHERATDLAVWRSDVARLAREAGVTPYEGAVTLSLTFHMQRPKTVKRDEPHVRPDLDKLVRAVMDGLTGVAYEDDQQVCQLHATKRYGDQVGVGVTITGIHAETA